MSDETTHILPDAPEATDEATKVADEAVVNADAPEAADEATKVADTPAEAPKAEKPARRPLVKKFDIYIIKNFLGTYVFAILLLFAIVIMFDVNEKLDAVINAPWKETVFKYFLNFLPFVASQFSPLFTFIAVIFFTSRLADRSEIIAMLSSGISFNRLAIPYIVSAAVIAASSYALSAYVIPPANVKRIEYTNQWVKNKAVVYADNVQMQVREGLMAYLSRYDNTTRTGFRFSLDEYDEKLCRPQFRRSARDHDNRGVARHPAGH